MAKRELTITEFRAIIKEEAFKLKKRIVLENEKKALQIELNNILSESCEDSSIEEGLFDGPKAYRKTLAAYAQKYGLKTTEEEFQALTQQMIDDKGQGFPGRVNGKLIYRPGKSVKMGQGFGGHAFGSGI